MEEMMMRKIKFYQVEAIQTNNLSQLKPIHLIQVLNLVQTLNFKVPVVAIQMNNSFLKLCKHRELRILLEEMVLVVQISALELFSFIN